MAVVTVICVQKTFRSSTNLKQRNLQSLCVVQSKVVGFDLENALHQNKQSVIHCGKKIDVVKTVRKRVLFSGDNVRTPSHS
jgi:hypothetical protein